jgi:hypothetical protein
VFDSVDRMLDVCLRPAVTAAHLASAFLRPGGVLMLTGSDAALKPTPSMIGWVTMHANARACGCAVCDMCVECVECLIICCVVL